MKTGFLAFFVLLAILFSYEVALGEELGTSYESNEVSRATAENELQIQVRKNEEERRRVANDEEASLRSEEKETRTIREGVTSIKGRY